MAAPGSSPIHELKHTVAGSVGATEEEVRESERIFLILLHTLFPLAWTGVSKEDIAERKRNIDFVMILISMFPYSILYKEKIDMIL